MGFTGILQSTSVY